MEAAYKRTVGEQIGPVSPLAILAGRLVEDALVRLARNALPATAQLFLDNLIWYIERDESEM